MKEIVEMDTPTPMSSSTPNDVGPGKFVKRLVDLEKKFEEMERWKEFISKWIWDQFEVICPPMGYEDSNFSNFTSSQSSTGSMATDDEENGSANETTKSTINNGNQSSSSPAKSDRSSKNVKDDKNSQPQENTETSSSAIQKTIIQVATSSQSEPRLSPRRNYQVSEKVDSGRSASSSSPSPHKLAEKPKENDKTKEIPISIDMPEIKKSPAPSIISGKSGSSVVTVKRGSPIRTLPKHENPIEIEETDDIDDDIPCSVCYSTMPEDGNEMIFCDKCNMCVHQACYGVRVLPEKDKSWVCAPCKAGLNTKELQCKFCPIKGGAYKPVQTPRNDKWAHVMCAIWIPEVSFGKPQRLTPVVGIPLIDKHRYKLKCSLCVRDPNAPGVCIQCGHKKCLTAFHVGCAFEKKLVRKEVDNDDLPDGILMKMYCKVHGKMYSGDKTGSGEKQKKGRKRKSATTPSPTNLPKVPRGTFLL